MPVPKRRQSRSRTRKRRAHDSLSSPNLVPCPNCAEMIKPHRMCPFCGFYKTKSVKEVKEA
jgi:large subunit ribosomal protein L32